MNCGCGAENYADLIRWVPCVPRGGVSVCGPCRARGLWTPHRGYTHESGSGLGDAAVGSGSARGSMTLTSKVSIMRKYDTVTKKDK